jgi:hypothetical protein
MMPSRICSSSNFPAKKRPKACARCCSPCLHRDDGIPQLDQILLLNGDFMKEAARTLQSGNAALFLLIRKMTTDKVLAALKGVGGTLLRSSFDETREEALRAALAGVQAASA